MAVVQIFNKWFLLFSFILAGLIVIQINFLVWMIEIDFFLVWMIKINFSYLVERSGLYLSG